MGSLEVHETAYRLLEVSVLAESAAQARERVVDFVDRLPAEEVPLVLKVIAVEFGWRYVSRAQRGIQEARVLMALERLEAKRDEAKKRADGSRVVVPFERKSRG